MATLMPGRQGKAEYGLLTAIQHVSLNDRVYEQLKAAIMLGGFPPGETLTLRALAETFGTSVMPVRDAVRRLAAQQALEILPTRLIRVPPISRGRFEELWRLRIMLEAEASGRAAERASTASIALIETAQEAFLEAVAREDLSSILKCNYDFMFSVYEASSAPILLSMIESLWIQSGPYYNIIVHSSTIIDYIRQSHSNDELLVQAVRDHDPASARRARELDLDELGNWFRARFWRKK